jgi:glycosyltransferase involved in cell wall biosynthesis
MSAGAVLVYNPVGGLIDTLTDGKNGYKLKSILPDPNEIAEKIIRLMDNQEIMIKMSENNINEAKQKYDTKILIEKIENIYQMITSNH